MLHKIFVLTIVLFSLTASAQSALSSSELREKTSSFINAYSERQQPDSDIGDIDYFLSLFADEFMDEHIKYNITITDKEELRKGMVDKLQNKVYYHNVKIDEMMFGKNVAFVKITIAAKVKPFHMDKIIEHTSSQIMSIEFDDNGLVKHLRRHHN